MTKRYNVYNKMLYSGPQQEEVFASLKKKEFSISESDGARWLAVCVCVNLTGRLTTPVTVQLGTVAESAEGIIIYCILS